MDKSIWILIPSYNEGQSKSLGLYPTIQNLYSKGYSYQVCIVDDGSSDNTKQLVADFPVHYLRHPINLGQGAALQTGFEFCLLKNADVIVTFDADGQHSADEIPLLVQPIVNGECDVVLGSRFSDIKPENLPTLRKWILKGALLYTKLTTGLKLTDTYNGFRALSYKAADQIFLKQNGMAHASEILSQISRNQVSYKEVPVTIKYTEYSLRKGQKLTNAINILWDLFSSGKNI